MRAAALIGIVVALACAGCQSTGSGMVASDPAARDPVDPFAGESAAGETWRGQNGAAAEPATIVARSDREWRDLWARIGEPPPVGLPDGRMAVAILLGRRDTAGYAVTIDSVGAEGGRTVVVYRERVPGPATPVAQMLTSPYAVALAPSAGDVEFRRGS